MSDQINNTSVTNNKYNKDNSSIIIESAFKEDCISTDSVKHNEN
jgi:hypothetical protein